jgi:ankyrin repeat protein
MRLLLDLGADPTLKYKWGSIARFAAAGLGWNYLPGGDAARLRLCLELRCDPNETDRRGVTLVADAARTGDVERVRVLLDAGASPNGDRTIIPSSFEPTPDSPFDDTAPSSFRIPLHNAVEADDLESVRLLLAAGADLHALDHGGGTALFGARSTEVAHVLTDAGLNIDAHDSLGWSPLLAAVMNGSLEGVKALLSVGADVNATHDRGFTVFMSAVGAMERNMEIINTVLETGADPHAITELGWNAFHAAVDVSGAEANSEESVRSILGRLKELGVNINHQNARGITPIEMAWGIEVDVLLELGAKRS